MVLQWAEASDSSWPAKRAVRFPSSRTIGDSLSPSRTRDVDLPPVITFKIKISDLDHDSEYIHVCLTLIKRFWRLLLEPKVIDWIVSFEHGGCESPMGDNTNKQNLITQQPISWIEWMWSHRIPRITPLSYSMWSVYTLCMAVWTSQRIFRLLRAIE